ncbi:MAG: ribonuclease Z [Candidatus Firestonebacteria bacterium]
MEITILGSGTGIPNLQRNAAGILIEVQKERLLFDTGPGIMKKLLESGITYHDIPYVFYTHFHPDHTLDLAVLLFAAKYNLSLRTKKLSIIGPKGLKNLYHGLLNVYGSVLNPEAYQIYLQEIEEQSLTIGSLNIRALHTQHTPESMGYRIESQNAVVVYSGDTEMCENIIALGKDADILILDCSFPNELKAKGHLIPQEAAEIAKACHCKKLILSHLYPVCQPEEAVKQARKIFKEGEVKAAFDLMRFTF